MEVLNQPNEDQTNDLLEQGYTLNSGRYIKEGYSMFKKNAPYFVAYTLLLGLVEASINYSHYKFNLFSLLYPVFTAGYYEVASKLDRDEAVEFKDFFKGLNRFLPLFIAGILIALIVAIGFILLIIPGIYLAVGYSLVIPFIVFQNRDFWPAMETSRKVVSKEWFSFFVFTLFLLGINILGALCLLVGLLVSIPVSYLAVYAAYKDIVTKGQAPVSAV